MSSLAKANEELSRAVQGLVGRRSLLERLSDAMIYHVIHVPTDAMSEELRAELEKLLRYGTQVPSAADGAVRRTIAAMTEDEREQMAWRIADIAGRVQIEYTLEHAAAIRPE